MVLASKGRLSNTSLSHVGPNSGSAPRTEMAGVSEKGVCIPQRAALAAPQKTSCTDESAAAVEAMRALFRQLGIDEKVRMRRAAEAR